MPTSLDWLDIATRLGLAVAAGALLGIDRTARGRPAGMRTAMMVSLAAAFAMVLAEMISSSRPPLESTGARFDMLRMAQGILAGMGFIGAGAIVRRGDAVLGITTAATLWFATILGLGFGAGHWEIGLAGLVAGGIILWPMSYIEDSLGREFTGELTVSVPVDGPSEREIRARVEQGRYITSSWTIHVHRPDGDRTLSCRVRWRARPHDERIPPFVAELSDDLKVHRVKWEPVMSG
jgi:putative Mg2+ transporter-C (MgtC) family protein